MFFKYSWFFLEQMKNILWAINLTANIFETQLFILFFFDHKKSILNEFMKSKY